jgi:hypothetical protein
MTPLSDGIPARRFLFGRFVARLAVSAVARQPATAIP